MSDSVPAIAALVREQLDEAPGEITEASLLENDLRMNSAQVIDLLSRVEDHFGCTIDDEDLGNIHRVGDLATIVDRGGAG
ncbi:acyl carrier protein [Amycolatopsis sp. WAC 04182]|uniref:acyl carrier protein n=1 Tax=Amycolatopsis sp. WAC 04182 TaxID=2203198 RepID=UPI000F7AA408|nr:acyl carrier protein [Amycolatopsis sp. WAC 04182]RSN54427.1 acyl carrier protein [Amycolatopsis sp. WAC 04182]